MNPCRERRSPPGSFPNRPESPPCRPQPIADRGVHAPACRSTGRTSASRPRPWPSSRCWDSRAARRRRRPPLRPTEPSCRRRRRAWSANPPRTAAGRRHRRAPPTRPPR
ncbi:MAG: hypothetical protein EBZ59_02865 [Planctomycetia bacterium]|nr:hypothetical protein [Planctomycetia bacterium]